MCLAQEPQRSDAAEARTHGTRSQVKHSTTEPLHSLNTELTQVKIKKYHKIVNNFSTISFKYVVGAHLMETVLLSTNNICFG